MYEEYKYSNHLKKIILVIMILFIPIAIAVGLINYNVLGTPAGDSFAAGVVALVPGLFLRIIYCSLLWILPRVP